MSEERTGHPQGPAAPRKVVTACVLIIGNEILSGRTQDANLAFIAKGLAEVGVRLKEARVIPDDDAVIVATLNEMRPRFDYVFTTGGIGPTHDDITAQSVANAFGVPLRLHDEAKRLFEGGRWRGELDEARLRMAHLPEGARLLKNPVSRAPGFAIGNVYVLPGVPSIMRGIFDALKEGLEGGDRVFAKSVGCHLAEGRIARQLGALQERFSDLEIGSYPYFHRGDFGVTLVLRGTDRTRLEAATEELKTLIRDAGGDPKEEPDEE